MTNDTSISYEIFTCINPKQEFLNRQRMAVGIDLYLRKASSFLSPQDIDDFEYAKKKVLELSDQQFDEELQMIKEFYQEHPLFD